MTNCRLATRYLRGATGDIVARRSATIAYTLPGFFATIQKSIFLSKAEKLLKDVDNEDFRLVSETMKRS